MAGGGYAARVAGAARPGRGSRHTEQPVAILVGTPWLRQPNIERHHEQSVVGGFAFSVYQRRQQPEEETRREATTRRFAARMAASGFRRTAVRRFPGTTTTSNPQRTEAMKNPDLQTLKVALTQLPIKCRYHGDRLQREDTWNGIYCCDTGRPALLRRRAEAALQRLESRLANGDSS